MARETWGSRVGFVAAAVGSAVGLGNIWMFPMRVGLYGGAAFLLPYLVLLFAIGVVALTVEWTLGRATKGGPIEAFSKTLPGGKYLGILVNVTMLMIFAFYSLVLGWILRYFIASLTGELAGVNPGAFFDSIAFSKEALLWQFIVIAITISIVAMGVQKGIERANKVMMPALFVFLLILTIRSVTLPNAYEGLRFYLLPDWSKVMSGKTWMIALSQMFFSLSVLGNTMVVYGSYLKDEDDIPLSAIATAFGDTAVAVTAGFLVFPAVFSFGLEPTAGPGLVFVTLPMVFQKMPGGMFFGALFFLLLIFAGLSSTVSMLEVYVDSAITKLNISRRNASILLGLLTFLVGAPSAVNPSYFDWLINISTVYIGPLGALIAALALIKLGVDKAYEELKKGALIDVPELWKPWVKFLYPIVIAVIYISQFLLG
ncbi:transporter [Thermococcus litoralis DSM 5473]|uniref:Transporter n=1 Tax=Thermococcus litoralis (strain ATCC 51850 / DSM 5473 / JCM 8560 / NS-C) TaxID=523849 RepID=H3ZK86_THELN|nr:sodium-dependent transporter [Thermococcus litoralis]EHR79639.1 transporter [Thermococcus litoralis DSM 5473]